MARQLTVMETAILRILAEQDRGSTPTAVYLARTLVNDYGLDASPRGVNTSIGSLLKKNLAWPHAGDGVRWYGITQAGRNALKGDRAGQWIAREISTTAREQQEKRS
jgi:hypothetical protein